MRVKAERSELADALTWTNKAVGTPMQPALSGALVTAEDGWLTIRTTDGSVTAQARVPAAIDEPGTVLLPRRIAAAVARFPDAPIEVTGGERIVLTCGRASASAPPLMVDDFPPAPEVEGVELPVGSDVLERIAKHVAPFIGEPRGSAWFLPNVRIAAKDGRLELFASDTYVAVWLEASAPAGVEVTAPVPPELFSQAPRDGGAVLTVGERHAQLKAGDRTLTVTVYTGTYPDPAGYWQDNPKRWTVEREELIASLQRIETVAAANNPIVRLQVAEGVLSLASRGGDSEEMHDALEVFATEDGRIDCSPSKLRRAIACHHSEQVELGVSANRPITVTSDDERIRHIVMPIKAKD